MRGNIRSRGKGTWEVRIDIGRDPLTGKRRQVSRTVRGRKRHAERWQLLSRNPADAVDAPRPQRYEIAAQGPDDLKRLLDSADQTRYGPLVSVALLTGLRMGELFGLRWLDVDLDNGVLRVQQTCQWLSGEGFIFRQPKSHRSTRPVALSPDTVEILRGRRVSYLEERLAAGTAYEDNGLVFADALGRPLHPHTVWDGWRRIVKATGLPRLRFHDLRHAHASLLMAQGVHPKIVSERLGHSSVSITLDISSHVAPNLQADAAAGLDTLRKRGNA